jgi:hypothetical protein|nr:MAG TPA_asm: hypothetical protein [Caudoviricetes sp.]
MTTYTITNNAKFDSREVSFDDKPQVSVLSALKALGMRWNSKRVLWYGFASEDEIKNAIMQAQPEEVPAQIAQAGYLGAVAISGAKSNRRLYGAELSAAIRADIKAAGIKGVTVKVKEFSGGQEITATIKGSAADCADRAEYIDKWTPGGRNWIDLGDDGTISARDFYAMEDGQNEIRMKAAAIEYDARTCAGFHSVNQYHIDSYTEFTPEFIAKINAVNAIIRNYNYDDSNSMVDYFDTNFYYDLYVKIC